MLLLFFLIAGLLIGQLRGGGLSGLVRMDMRAPGLVVLPFLVEFSFRFLNSNMLARIPYGLYMLQCLRYGPLLLFVLLNLRDWRIVLAGIGVLMNFTVILVNGARMPISHLATAYPQLDAQVQRVLQGAVPEYVLMSGPASVPLWFFADILILRFPVMGFASVGDVVLGIGLLLVVQHGMARYSRGRHVRGNLAVKEPVIRRQTYLYDGVHMQIEQAAAMPDVSAGSFPAITETSANPLPQDGVLCASGEIPCAELGLEPLPQQEVGSEPVVESRLTEVAFDAQPAVATAPSAPVASPQAPSSDGQPYPLSPRLAQIADMVPQWASVADVGCDHGKLAVHLAQRGTPLVIATDISAKSLAKAKALIRECGLQRQIKTRVSDGLKHIRPGEVDAIVIAGIGGPTICDILNSNPAVISSIGRLVLQPQNAVGTVRAWIVGNGFHVEQESIAQDDGRLYQVLCAVPGVDGTRLETLFDQEIGAVLVRQRHLLLPQLLQERIATIDTILEELDSAQSPRAQSRRIELMALRTRCQEVLTWSVR